MVSVPPYCGSSLVGVVGGGVVVGGVVVGGVVVGGVVVAAGAQDADSRATTIKQLATNQTICLFITINLPLLL